MLIIEVDGYSHDFKYDYDNQRQKKLEDLGFNIIRFGDQQVKNDMFNVLRALEITIGRLNLEKDGSEERETTSPLPPPKGESEKSV
jgi:very-short-patch-repair endonuclease